MQPLRFGIQFSLIQDRLLRFYSEILYCMEQKYFLVWFDFKSDKTSLKSIL